MIRGRRIGNSRACALLGTHVELYPSESCQRYDSSCGSVRYVAVECPVRGRGAPAFFTWKLFLSSTQSMPLIRVSCLGHSGADRCNQIYHRPSSAIIVHHPPSSSIIRHHRPSSSIIVHHPSIIVHHRPSSVHHPSIIVHHPSIIRSTLVLSYLSTGWPGRDASCSPWS